MKSLITDFRAAVCEKKVVEGNFLIESLSSEFSSIEIWLKKNLEFFNCCARFAALMHEFEVNLKFNLKFLFLLASLVHQQQVLLMKNEQANTERESGR